MQISSSAPIGVFDSGFGGLTVIRALQQAMPQEGFIYYGDTAHVPYGNRSPEELKSFALQIGNYLAAQGCKLLFIACNTSTALAYDLLQEKLSIPVVGVIEPVVEQVRQAGGKAPIGVIATAATVNSGVYQRLFASKIPERTVHMMACPAFVPLVEAGITSGPKVNQAVDNYLAPLKAAGINTLVMGCTHYPFLIEEFRSYLGPEVQLLDPALATVEQGRSLLAELGLLAQEKGLPTKRFISSGDPDQFRQGGHLFLPEEIQTVEQVILSAVSE